MVIQLRSIELAVQYKAWLVSVIPVRVQGLGFRVEGITRLKGFKRSGDGSLFRTRGLEASGFKRGLGVGRHPKP